MPRNSDIRRVGRNLMDISGRRDDVGAAGHDEEPVEAKGEGAATLDEEAAWLEKVVGP